MVFESESIFEQRIFWWTVVGLVVTAVCSFISIKDSIPTIVKFGQDEWKPLPNGDVKLVIPAERHGKGSWPSYKVLDNSGSAFFTQNELVHPNGDIELHVTTGSKIGIDGRVFIK